MLPFLIISIIIITITICLIMVIIIIIIITLFTIISQPFLSKSDVMLKLRFSLLSAKRRQQTPYM